MTMNPLPHDYIERLEAVDLNAAPSTDTYRFRYQCESGGGGSMGQAFINEADIKYALDLDIEPSVYDVVNVVRNAASIQRNETWIVDRHRIKKTAPLNILWYSVQLFFSNKDTRNV